jgi:hypothetical protein
MDVSALFRCQCSIVVDPCDDHDEQNLTVNQDTTTPLQKQPFFCWLLYIAKKREIKNQKY